MKFNRTIFFIYILLTILISNCAGLQEKEYYNDQEILECKHNPENDLKVYKKNKYAMIFVNKIKTQITDKEIKKIFSEVETEYDKAGIPIINHNDFIKLARRKGQFSLLQQIEKKQDNTPCLYKLGKRTKVDFFIIPVLYKILNRDEVVWINEDSYEDWGGFSSWQKNKTCSIDIYYKVFDVANKTFNKEILLNSIINDYYDTTESYTSKMDRIRDENIRRRAENRRRKFYNDRIDRLKEEEMEKSKKKKKATFFDVIDAIIDDPDDGKKSFIPLLNESIKFKEKDYITDKEHIKAAIKDCFQKVFKKFYIKFDGETISGNTINGTGTFKFINEEIYSGEWENSRAQGNGIYTYPNGAKYEGQFNDGYADGKGTYIDEFGNKYEGPYVFGLKDGEGLYTDAKGQTVRVTCDQGDYIKMEKIIENQ